jgi:hypothetical protein
MDIFDNTFQSGVAEDVMTAATILSTARPAERKAFMESLNPQDSFAQQLKVVDETLTAIATAAQQPTDAPAPAETPAAPEPPAAE